MHSWHNLRRRHASCDDRSSAKWSGWRGLQTRMTVSYVWMTVLLVLLIVMLGGLLLVSLFNIFGEEMELSLLQRAGAEYAYAASLQSDGLALNSRSTFEPGQAYTLLPPGNDVPGENERRGGSFSTPIAPYVYSSNPNLPVEGFALLIAPDGHIVASSYSARYPLHTSISTLLSSQKTKAVERALRGAAVYAKQLPYTLYVTVPVWGKNGRPIGVFYGEAQRDVIGGGNVLLFFQNEWFIPVGIILLALLITTPIGSLFGLLTTRGLVRRIRHLAETTTRFAQGDLEKRVQIRRQDELGQMEHDFNAMADQLVESAKRQQELTDQNARLAERTRLARELHDAISQDLFSLRMLAYGLEDALPEGSPFHTQVTTLEQTSGRVIHEMRALLLELRPAHLEQLGLVEALKALVAGYNERLEITIAAEIAPVSLPPEVEHTLLRISQEALSNAVRHAHATQISLTLEKIEQGVRLSIQDNGTGFAPEEGLQRHGLGLHSMRGRVQELQGVYTLASAPGQGTHVTVDLPQEVLL